MINYSVGLLSEEDNESIVDIQGDSESEDSSESEGSLDNENENISDSEVLDYIISIDSNLSSVNENLTIINENVNNFLGLYLIVFIIAQISSWRRSI